MTSRKFRSLRHRAAWLAVGLLAGSALTARAEASYDLFVSAGGAEQGTRVATVGIGRPGAWRRDALGGEFSGRMETFVSHWSVRPAAGGREGYSQIALVPLLRYRFANGRSNWFAEGGIGLSVMDSLLQTPSKSFGLRFNFYDVLAVGRSFGDAREHELSLRIAHVSNGGLKKPNPGEELVQLRYARRF